MNAAGEDAARSKYATDCRQGAGYVGDVFEGPVGIYEVKALGIEVKRRCVHSPKAHLLPARDMVAGTAEARYKRSIEEEVTHHGLRSAFGSVRSPDAE